MSKMFDCTSGAPRRSSRIIISLGTAAVFRGLIPTYLPAARAEPKVTKLNMYTALYKTPIPLSPIGDTGILQFAIRHTNILQIKSGLQICGRFGFTLTNDGHRVTANVEGEILMPKELGFNATVQRELDTTLYTVRFNFTLLKPHTLRSQVSGYQDRSYPSMRKEHPPLWKMPWKRVANEPHQRYSYYHQNSSRLFDPVNQTRKTSTRKPILLDEYDSVNFPIPNSIPMARWAIGGGENGSQPKAKASWKSVGRIGPSKAINIPHCH
ncbi:hypothetical protein C8R43DRAFT_965935 [Mycena crocata]|nr:hypothetical protein C8R43DRAFT_965935 [Mycena crocata]